MNPLNTRLSRRQVLQCALGLAAVQVLGGCAVPSSAPSTRNTQPPAGGAATTAAVPAQATAASGAQVQTLTVLSHAGASEPGLRAMAQKFTAAKGGNVQVEITATPLDQLNRKALAEFTAQSSAFDLLTLNDQWTSSWAPHLVPIKQLPGYDPKDYAQIIPALMNMAAYKGEYYGLPHRVGANILYYRKDLLEQKGLQPPRTQDDYVSVAKALTGNGIYGAVLEGKGSPYSTLDYVTWLWARGAREIDEGITTPLLDQPAAVATAQWYTDLYTKHKVVPPDSLSYTYEQQVTGMQQGIVGMMIDYSARVSAVEDASKSKVAGKLGYALVPLGEGVTRKPGTDYMAGHSLAVSKYSKRQGLAYEFAKFCTTPDAQLEMALKYANGPTIEAVYKNPEYVKVVPPADIILQALSTARTRFSHPQWNDMDVALGEALDAIFTGRKTPEEAMLNCNERWKGLLRG